MNDLTADLGLGSLQARLPRRPAAVPNLRPERTLDCECFTLQEWVGRGMSLQYDLNFTVSVWPHRGLKFGQETGSVQQLPP